ncbi:PPC domain-containing protein [Brevundimonas sp.]|uniref:PPC domain-containing protein n=1 Tax=Brevundimonas sp. TaxID=1871086 RepID=UPI002FC65B22
MRSSFLLTVSTIVLLAAAPMAVAQTDGGVIQIGDRVDGNTGMMGREYQLELREGQGVEIVMRSSDIDSFLSIYGPDDANEALVSDDDGLGEGFHSRLRFYPRQSGTYTLKAEAIDDSDGAFQLSVAAWQPERVRSTNIRKGGNASGRLNARSPLTDSGNRFQQYRLMLAQGERVDISARSEDLDSVLAIGHDSPAFVALAENDDYAGEGLNARIVFTAPEAGAYAVRVSSFGSSAEGRFDLSVAEPKPMAEARPVTLGEEMSGELTDKTDTGFGGVSADRYALVVAAGQPHEISLNSDDFDSYLAVYDANGVEKATDDDSGGSLNASLIFTPEVSGEYIIEARSLGSSKGSYTLLVEAVEPPPAPVALPMDEEVEGELTDDDARASSAGRYDGYVFSATKGQRLQITLTSADFDATLEVGSAEGTFKALASDDDGMGNSTDSRLVFEVPEDGEYVVRASSYGGDGRGAYEIRMIDRGPAPQAGSLLVGSTVRGSLSEYDNTSDGGMMGSPYYDDYRFTAKKDEKLRFILVAPKFDAVVMVGSGEGEEFNVAKQDDDGLSETHSRLNWTAPRDGDYVVRVTSFGSNSTGDYSLIVEPQS